MSRSEHPLRSRFVFLGALMCALATMAPTCSKSDDKKHAEETDEDDRDTRHEDVASPPTAAPSASAVVDAAVPEVPGDVAAAAPAGSDALFKDPAAVVESFDDGSGAFVVDPDGAVRMALADPQGKAITDRTAKLRYESAPNKFVDVPLAYDAERHLYVGKIPELVGSITPVTYEIIGGPKPWTGVIHIPEGGTRVINVAAESAATVHATPLTGPHGGRIERVGDDDVEVLLDPDTGESRAWIIVAGRVAPPRQRAVALYIDDRYVEMYPDLNDSFYARVSFSPGFSFRTTRRLSVALSVGPVVHTCLFGFRPHVRMFAFRPIVDVRVRGWTREGRVRWDHHPNTAIVGWEHRERHFDRWRVHGDVHVRGHEHEHDHGHEGGHEHRPEHREHEQKGGDHGHHGGGDHGGGDHGGGGHHGGGDHGGPSHHSGGGGHGHGGGKKH